MWCGVYIIGDYRHLFDNGGEDDVCCVVVNDVLFCVEVDTTNYVELFLIFKIPSVLRLYVLLSTGVFVGAFAAKFEVKNEFKIVSFTGDYSRQD